MVSDDNSIRLSECPGWFVKPKSRRLGEVFFSDATFLRLFQHPRLQWSVEANPLPEDARIVGVEYRPLPGGWRVFIESDTLDEVPENQTPPLLPSMTLHVQMPDDPLRAAGQAAASREGDGDAGEG